MELSRSARDRIKRGLHGVFELGQRAGLDVLPRHFYSSIPNLHELRNTHPWRAASSMYGVAGTDTQAQLNELLTWFTPEVREYLTKVDVHAEAVQQNGAEGFGPMESQMLYAYAATQRPSRVVQIGAGVSTAVLLQVKKANDLDLQIVAVDPYPTQLLSDLASRGEITLIEEPAQAVDINELTSLGAGDLLFVDSTHTVKPGSEVNRLILEVFPRLADDVTVHVHDITFPYDYPPNLLDEQLFFWTESTLLHAFLVNNPKMSIRVAGSMLAHAHRDELRDVFAGYQPAPLCDGLFDGLPQGRHFPASIYLQTHAAKLA